MLRPSKKELAVKTLIYRLFVILYEGVLAFVFGYFGIKLVEFVLINNFFKLLGYFIMELWWFRYLRTRFMLLEKLILDKIRKTLK
ncbi:MAG: hypothetical protein QXI11_00930 [Thermoproteota archaeon]